jgi:D-beta-D-heptose 7-phosphate kinase/D-beta-D-heptose 1-phosphate adenosyltransferase
MSPKIVKLNDLVQIANDLRKSGQRIVFTNGCFDIMHVGHIRYLTAAKSEGDVLIAGLNSDKSVKKIKSKGRPIVNQDQRAEVLAGLACVDYVTVFDESDPLELIKALKPDVLVKGADWQEKDIIGAEFIKAHGGKVVRVAFVPDISTSQIIQRIYKRFRTSNGTRKSS